MNEHEVAVTVFATVQGVDAADAANRLERLVMDRMLWNGHGFELPSHAGITTAPSPVHTVVNATSALGNGGYYSVTVGTKARRESPHNAS
jgi:hypothetical protein